MGESAAHLTLPQLRAARLRYFTAAVTADTAPPVCASVAADAADVTVTNVSSDTSDVNDTDEKRMRSECCDSDFEDTTQRVRNAKKRAMSKKQVRHVGTDFLAESFNSTEAVIAVLKTNNAACFPRVRSSAGKYIRFNCKIQGCSLSAYGIRSSSITLNPSKYCSGSCGIPKTQHVAKTCENCHDPPGDARCPNGHVFCDECFSHLVHTQCHGGNRAQFISAASQLYCTYCDPKTVIDIKEYSRCLHQSVWSVYLSAVAEAAVIAEQKRAQESSHKDQTIAVIDDIITNKCPNVNCRVKFADFSGCLALKCGRSESNVIGCGTEFCGYCSTICADEMAVHEHLRSCVWNPRPSTVFPGRDFLIIKQQMNRERVWNHVVTQWSDKIPAIWSMIQESFPDLGITTHWLAQRQMWLDIVVEVQMEFSEFVASVPKYMRCVLSLEDMGFGHSDSEDLIRVTLLNKGDLEKSTITLLQNNAAAAQRQINDQS
jgi:hypothetical protein